MAINFPARMALLAVGGALTLSGCAIGPQTGPCGAYGAHLAAVSARIEAGSVSAEQAKAELETMKKLRVKCLGEEQPK